MSLLRVTPVQADLQWESPAANRAHFDTLLAPLAGRTDVVVLPEMFTTGFTMQPQGVAERMDGETVAWLRGRAKQLDAVITGSLVIEEEGNYRNRLIWMQPDGTHAHYDKRHGFSPAGEQEVYRNGERRLTVAWRGWRVCPLICYDLRFPVWSRNADLDYDLIIYTANWPAARAAHWRSLLSARAIENQAFCVGVNRVGRDANALTYRGDSRVIDYAGEVRWAAALGTATGTVALDRKALRSYRERLPFFADADRFELG